VIGWEDSRDIFCVKGFPLQRPDWRVIWCSGLLYVFPTRNIVNFLIKFTFFHCNILFKGMILPIVLKVLLNCSQSIGHH